MKVKDTKDEHFSQCCATCEGKCCRVGGLYITKQEYKIVPAIYRKRLQKHYSGYITYPGKQCPFLKNDGCVFGEDRFLECKLYPLEINGIDKLILKSECPHNQHFNNKAFFKKGYILLEKYIKEGMFNKDDVVGILNNDGWKAVENKISEF